MKFSSIRWLFVAGVVGAGITGVVSSNVGCGDSANTTDGGGGGRRRRRRAARSRPGSPTPSTPTSRSWTLSNYVDANYFNWGATTDPDSGVGLDGGVAPTLEWSSADGDPTPGSLKVTVTFTGFKQYIDPQVNLATPQDFSGTHRHREGAHPPGVGHVPVRRRPVPRVERPDWQPTRMSMSRRCSSTRPA